MPEQPGLLLVISGPSGVGKTTISTELERRLNIASSVSMTTRPKTASETDGVDYDFVSPQQFDQALADGQLLEWAEVFGNRYGTPRRPVQQQLAAGRVVLLKIDVNGAIQVRRNFPDALMIFILPPSESALLDRLRGRGRESEEIIQRRFAEAQREIRQARDSGAYDHFVTNEDLNHAIDQAMAIIQGRLNHGQPDKNRQRSGGPASDPPSGAAGRC